MSNPYDDVPVQGGMSTTGNSNTRNAKGVNPNNKKLGYINLSLGGERVGSITIETEPYGFKTNETHQALLDLFSLNLTPEQLKQGVEALLQYGITFDCQLASKVAEKPKAKIDFSAMFAGAAKREIK